MGLAIGFPKAKSEDATEQMCQNVNWAAQHLREEGGKPEFVAGVAPEASQQLMSLAGSMWADMECCLCHGLDVLCSTAIKQDRSPWKLSKDTKQVLAQRLISNNSG